MADKNKQNEGQPDAADAAKGNQEQLAAAEARVKELETQLAEQAQATKAAEDAADAAKSEANDLRRELDGLARSKGALESRLEQIDASYQHEIQMRDNKIGEQSNVIAELKTRVSSLSGKLDQIVSTIESGRDLLNNFKKKGSSGGVRQPPAFVGGAARPGYNPAQAAKQQEPQPTG